MQPIGMHVPLVQNNSESTSSPPPHGDAEYDNGDGVAYAALGHHGKELPRLGRASSADSVSTATNWSDAEGDGDGSVGRVRKVWCFEVGLRVRSWWRHKVKTSRKWRYLELLLSSLSLIVKVLLFAFLLVRTNELEGKVQDLQHRLDLAGRQADDALFKAETAQKLTEQAKGNISEVSSSLQALGTLLPDEDFEILVGAPESRFTGPRGLQKCLDFLKETFFAQPVTIKVRSGTYVPTGIPDFPSVGLVTITGEHGVDSVLEFSGGPYHQAFDYASLAAPKIKSITLKSTSGEPTSRCFSSGTLGAKLYIEDVHCIGWAGAVAIDGASMEVHDLHLSAIANEVPSIYVATGGDMRLHNFFFDGAPGLTCVVRAQARGFVWWQPNTDAAATTDCIPHCFDFSSYILTQDKNIDSNFYCFGTLVADILNRTHHN